MPAGGSMAWSSARRWLLSSFLSPLSDGQRIVGIAGSGSPGVWQEDSEEIVMSTPNEAGAPEPGSQAAAENSSGQRQTRRARLSRGAGAVMRHRATAIVGAALVGLLVGGGVVAAVDGPGHSVHHGGYRGHHGVLHQSVDGCGWFGNEER
jgi:hypothetical protein